MWVYSSPKPKMPDAVKVGVGAKATELVNVILKPEHIKPPPKNPKWNYVVDIYTKWHRNRFYFCAKYACPGPNALSLFFDTGFARLEYAGGVGRQSRFNLSCKRHTGKWWEIRHGRHLSNVWQKSEKAGSSTPELM